MNTLALTVCFVVILSCNSNSKYEKVFFATKDFPPKLETPFCDTSDGFLSQNADENRDFLIDQLLSTQRTGFSYYPIEYTYSDVANYILSMRYGRLVEYIPEFNYKGRFEANEEQEIQLYLEYLQQSWAAVFAEETNAKIRKNDCIE